MFLVNIPQKRRQPIHSLSATPIHNSAPVNPLNRATAKVAHIDYLTFEYSSLRDLPCKKIV